MVCGGLEGYGAAWGSELHTGGPLPGVSGITVGLLGPVTMSPSRCQQACCPRVRLRTPLSAGDGGGELDT